MSTHDSTPNSEIPYGYCQCGCGQKTTLATETKKRFCRIKGQPTAFLKGHRVFSYEKQLERFWSKVDKSGGEDACWLWLGCCRGNYGAVAWNGKLSSTHCISYELANGEIPDGLQVLHSCDHPHCVNPKHLSVGTHQDNMDDMVQKGRQATGEHNSQAKLTAEQVNEIRSLRAKEGESLGFLSARFGVSKTHISRIIRGESRKQSKGVGRG